VEMRTEAGRWRNDRRRIIYPVVCGEKECRSAGFRLVLPGLEF
jgi:hypothetical protein